MSLQDLSMMESQSFCLYTRNAFNAAVVTSAALFKELLAKHCFMTGITFCGEQNGVNGRVQL